MNKPYVSLLRKIGDISVYLVDGPFIRSFADVEFVGGSNGEANPDLVPKSEIWLEDGLVNKDRDFILCHELVELHLMNRGMDYPKAHSMANAVELFCRRHPENLQQFLKIGE